MSINIGKGVDLPLSIVTSKLAILAMTGMGKTYLAKVIAEEMLKAGAKIVVGDYTGVWWGLSSSASGKREGFDVLVFGGDHADLPLTEHSGKMIADLVVNERISAVLDVSGFEDDAPKIRFMTEFARRLYFANRKPVHFFLDEADEFVPQNPQRDQIQMLAVLKRIWQRGRVKGIGGSIISQRSASVHKTLLAQSEMLIALRTVSPQDRAALAAWFESWGKEEEIKQFNSTISNLADHHAWFWSPKHRLFVTSTARKLETFDSGATPDVVGGLEIDEPKVRTKHDLAKLGKEIEKLAIAEKEKDPEYLKKQLAHWKEQFEVGKNRIALLEKRLDDWKNAREKERTSQKIAKPIKIPMINAKTLKAIERTLRQLSVAREQMNTVSRSLAGSVEDLDANAERLRLDMERAKLAAIASLEGRLAEIPALSDQPGDRRLSANEAESPVKPAPGRQAAPGKAIATPGNGKVRGGEARILAALVQHGRSSESKVRILAGIKTPDTMRTYVWKLKRAGFIQEEGGALQATPAGLSALGEYDPLPTGKALIEHWRNSIGKGGQGRIFDVLLENPKDSFDDAQLMKRAGINSPDTLRTYVWKLSALGLIESRNGWTKVVDEFAGV